MKSLSVYAIDGVVPVVDPSAYVHPSAVLIGDVIVGPGCYVGPCASLRGDFGRLVLERGCNVQDTCVLHSYPGKDTVVGVNGHIGHGAMLHGCYVSNDVLVGMNSVVMDNVVVGEFSIIAASAFVEAGSDIPPGSLVAGVPAKIIRQVSDQEVEWKRRGTAEYQNLTRRSLVAMRETKPLTSVEPGRRRIPVTNVSLWLS